MRMSYPAIHGSDAEEWNPAEVAIELWNADQDAPDSAIGKNSGGRRSRGKNGYSSPSVRRSKSWKNDTENLIPAAELCDECNLHFSFMQVHMRVAHERLAEINCAFCGLPFDSNANLFSHLTCHEDRQLICCICRTKFNCDDALADHLDGHRELHVLSCCSCGRTFTTKSSQLAHECQDVSSVAPVSLTSGPSGGNMNVPLPKNAEDPIAAIQPDSDGSLSENIAMGDAVDTPNGTDSQCPVPTPGVKSELSSLAIGKIESLTSGEGFSKMGSEVVNGGTVSQLRKRISFNERTEIWQWELKVKSFGDLQEGVDIVPVNSESESKVSATPPPAKRSKRSLKSASGRAKKKRKKAAKDEETAAEQPTSEQNATETNGNELRNSEEKETKYGNRFKNREKLEALYGKGFCYRQCVKIDGRYHCPDETCSDNNHRGYGNETMIRNHIRRNHMVDECYRCHECDRPFAIKSKLAEHLLTHKNRRKHKCTTCGDSFKTEIILKAHVMTHTCPWQCYHCHSKFGRKNTLKEHMRGTHCRICNIFFRCNFTFHRHEEEVKHVYSCSQCTTKTNTMARFLYHVRTTHYDETTSIDGKYVCDLCKRKFISKANASRHVRRAHVFREAKATRSRTKRKASVSSSEIV
ncbi:Zinc finger, C2H2 type [Nesidiocoris tenuis]|uniref:Zinc finger, C2H2 type n=1 Tax=Nesidiocoris tenuis TaxID=355587 RepID=A0ABN7BDL1_9HEMI|nr:Zinc finger, C2H2 type [Nesidiocoris tenuis]